MGNQEKHYCNNGVPVTDQVRKYQKTRLNDDYLPIQSYYDNYKDIWYLQLADYLDRATFEAEYNLKLCKAVCSYSNKLARRVVKKRGLTELGMFNRFFFRVLLNWKSNVKALPFRVKKNPSIQCPICGRFVAKIDPEHLEHFKSPRDLPKFFVWKKQIFEVCRTPQVFVTTYGDNDRNKWRHIKKGKTKDHSQDRSKIPWLWFIQDQQKGVMCPFTHKIVPVLDEEYIRTLPDKYSRYARPYKWHDFASEFPSCLIQHEIYSLEFFESDDVPLKDKINEREDLSSFIDYEMICKGRIPMKYQDVFRMIDTHVPDGTNRDILKLVTVGYAPVDIADTLNLEPKEVVKKLKVLKDEDGMTLLRDDIVGDIACAEKR